MYALGMNIFRTAAVVALLTLAGCSGSGTTEGANGVVIGPVPGPFTGLYEGQAVHGAVGVPSDVLLDVLQLDQGVEGSMEWGAQKRTETFSGAVTQPWEIQFVTDPGLDPGGWYQVRVRLQWETGAEERLAGGFEVVSYPDGFTLGRGSMELRRVDPVQ